VIARFEPADLRTDRFDDSSTLVAEYRRLATRLETLLQKDVGMTYPRRDESYENFIGTG
jgi:hypothetical protein